MVISLSVSYFDKYLRQKIGLPDLINLTFLSMNLISCLVMTRDLSVNYVGQQNWPSDIYFYGKKAAPTFITLDVKMMAGQMNSKKKEHESEENFILILGFRIFAKCYMKQWASLVVL